MFLQLLTLAPPAPSPARFYEFTFYGSTLEVELGSSVARKDIFLNSAYFGETSESGSVRIDAIPLGIHNVTVLL